MAGSQQTIQAKRATATFVPAGSTIKIINNSGTDVIDTWAFALPDPPSKNPKHDDGGANQDEDSQKSPEQPPKQQPKSDKTKKSDNNDLPSQEDAEKATAQGIQQDHQGTDAAKKSGWTSYLPSLSLRKSNADAQLSDKTHDQKTEDEKATTKKNSKTWSEYLGTGESYWPTKTAKDAVSSFAASHARDPSKSYAQQLSDFSRTPVGAAGLSVFSGQGYASSLYAGYNAWGSDQASDKPMEYLSLSHTRIATRNLYIREGDVLVSNLRAPMATVIQDTAGTSAHATMFAADDPAFYRMSGVEDWEEHGSSAENLVLALKELNERAGLKGGQMIGADVTVNSAPSPLSLFQPVQVDSNSGQLELRTPEMSKGAFVRLRAERDIVVVLSSCPCDVPDENGRSRQISDAHYEVEEVVDNDETDVRSKLAAASATKKEVAPSDKDSSSGPMSEKPAKSSKTDAGASTPKPRQPPKKLDGGAKKPSSGRTPLGTVKKVPTTKKAEPKSDVKPASDQNKEKENQNPSPGQPAKEKKKPRKLAARSVA